jgi:hypothetical protein
MLPDSVCRVYLKSKPVYPRTETPILLVGGVEKAVSRGEALGEKGRESWRKSQSVRILSHDVVERAAKDTKGGMLLIRTEAACPRENKHTWPQAYVYVGEEGAGQRERS